MNYDFYSLIIDSLNKKYNVNKNEDFFLNYLEIKTAIKKDKRKVEDNEIFELLLEELNIPHEDNAEKKVTVNIGGELKKESLLKIGRDFMENINFRSSLLNREDPAVLLEEIFRKGYQKAYKYRQLKEHSLFKEKARLDLLNEKFGVTVSPVDYEIDPFVYPESHDYFKRTREEELTSLIDASKHKLSEGTAFITEKQLEDYLIENLNEVEEGLRFLERQVPVDGGFIDILAKDKEGVLCILELKVNEDKAIIWQSIHYQKEIRKIRKVNKVRMITLANDYSSGVRSSLKMTPGVELYTYDVRVRLGEIKELDVKRAS